MESKVAKAHLKQLRMTPRKVKVVLDLIRNKNVAEAAAILKTTNKIACESVEKLLKSAVANAETNHGMDVEKLYVAECFVTPGKLKGMKQRDAARERQRLPHCKENLARYRCAEGKRLGGSELWVKR